MSKIGDIPHSTILATTMTKLKQSVKWERLIFRFDNPGFENRKIWKVVNASEGARSMQDTYKPST